MPGNPMNKTAISVILILLINASLLAHVEKTYYLTGKTETEEIAIELDEYGDVCLLRYITSNNIYEQIMEGKIPRPGRFELASFFIDSTTNTRMVKDSLILVEYEDDKWTGTWTYQDGEKETFELGPILIDSIGHPYASAIKKYDVSPFNAYRTRNTTFIDGKRRKIAPGIFIQEISDEKTGIQSFRVLPSKKKVPMTDSINEMLIADQLQFISGFYSCVNGEKGRIYDIKYDVHFINQHIISYTLITTTACRGARVQTSYSHQTRYMKNTDPVSMEDLFWFGSKPQPELIEGEYNWFQYRYKEFGPQVMDLLKHLYPEKFTTGNEVDCKYDNVKLWQLPTWYLTNDGLYLGSKSSMSNKNCDEAEWSVIPYKLLIPYISIDYLLLAGR